MKKLLLLSLLFIAFCSFGQTQETVVKKKGVNILIVDEDTPPTDPGCNCPAEVFKIRNVTLAPVPSVTLTKINGEWLFDFALVQGPKGDKGDKGITPAISATATSIPYTEPARVTQTGTLESPIFNFFIPQGQPGPPGSGGSGSLPNVYVINPALGADNNPDADTWQAAFNAAISTRGKVFIPAATNKWILEKTINIVGSQIYVDVEAYGRPGGIVYTGTGKAVFNILGLHSSHWEGLNIETPSNNPGVAIFDVDTNESIGSSSFNYFNNMYCNLNAANDVVFRFGKTSGPNVHGDISNWRIKNIVAYGPMFNPLPGTFLVQSLHGNVLANTVEDVFVAFCDGVFSNFSYNGSDRGGCFGTFKAIDTSQNICDFYFGREGTYPVFGGRMESDGMLFKTGGGSYNISVSFTGLRINDFKGNGVLGEINTPGTYTLNDCQMHRQTNQTFTDLLTLNGSGGFGTVIIDGGATRANNIVRKVGGGAQWKVYTRGLQRWQTPNAVNTEGWYPDQNGTPTL